MGANVVKIDVPDGWVLDTVSLVRPLGNGQVLQARFDRSLDPETAGAEYYASAVLFLDAGHNNRSLFRADGQYNHNTLAAAVARCEEERARIEGLAIAAQESP